MPARGLNAEPVALRQIEQWQFTAKMNSSGTLYVTCPHWQDPINFRAVFGLYSVRAVIPFDVAQLFQIARCVEAEQLIEYSIDRIGFSGQVSVLDML